MPRRLKTLAFISLNVTAFVALAGGRAYACQPCQSTLDLSRSLAKADLVVVAKRPEGAKPPDARASEPQCDELLVEGVLKGEAAGGKLRVRSFYGMCPYGIIFDKGTYVVILSKASSSDYDTVRYGGGCEEAAAKKGVLYVPVESGCAVKTLRVESGSVEAEGVKMTLDEFRDKYGLRGAGAAAAAGVTTGPLFGVWPGEYFGASLFAPAARSPEVTQ